MTISMLRNKINYRLILIHLLATVFLVLAFKQLSFLYDIDMIKLVNDFGYLEAIELMIEEGDAPSRIALFKIWQNISVLAGLTMSFMISILFVIRKKEFSINSIIVLLIAFCIIKFGQIGVSNIESLISYFGDYFSEFGIQYKFLTTGGLLMFVSLLLFFNRRTKSWMSNKKIN